MTQLILTWIFLKDMLEKSATRITTPAEDEDGKPWAESHNINYNYSLLQTHPDAVAPPFASPPPCCSWNC